MEAIVKEILTDEVSLCDWSDEIDTRKDGKLVQEITLALKTTMREKDLQYLTAPQIGYKSRIICLRFGDSDYRTFVNPVIENNVGMVMSRETCVSIPDKEFIIPRFGKIKFYYTTPLGDVKAATLVGRAAHIFQHALEHLNGMLVSDIGLEIDNLFDEASDEEREEVLKMYAESLDLRHRELVKEISEDKELSDLDDAIKFINSVRAGETVLQKIADKKETVE